MTTYFTPVGTLTELTRAKGSDINARESAVTAGFTALEAAIVPIDGTASITYGSTYSAVANRAQLKKSNGFVSLYLQVTCAGGASFGQAIATLPAGYRPPTQMDYIPGRYFAIGNSTVYNVFFQITTAGVISAPGAVPSLAAGDEYAIATTFWLT